MEKLPIEALESFMKGEHVTSHKRRIWNSIWSDVMIQTTYMNFGNGPGGIIRVTTQPRNLKVWTKNQHIQNKLLSDLECLRNKDESPNQVHKEETKARIASDNKNRKKLEILSRLAYTHLMLIPTTKIAFVMFTQEKYQLLVSMSINLWEMVAVN